MPDFVETLPALDALPGIHAAFLTRIPDVDVATDRETALARLKPRHDALVDSLGFSPPATAEQVHGTHVAIVEKPLPSPAPGADALVTATPGVTLGIYVADCAAIWLVDPPRRAIGLAHSGRKGTEGNILARTVATMQAQFGTQPADLVVAVSPCIRPPHYEVNFAATIAAQARDAGIGHFHDAGVCTASHPDRYYSYRREMGQTGRMLALLMLEPTGCA
jgi:copper oxidase (laccase) domain-containing protein